jgi:hypothetical protein
MRRLGSPAELPLGPTESGNFWLFGGYGYDAALVGRSELILDVCPAHRSVDLGRGKRTISKTLLGAEWRIRRGGSLRSRQPSRKLLLVGGMERDNGNFWLFGGWVWDLIQIPI